MDAKMGVSCRLQPAAGRRRHGANVDYHDPRKDFFLAVHGPGTSSFFGSLGPKNVPVPFADVGDSPM